MEHIEVEIMSPASYSGFATNVCDVVASRLESQLRECRHRDGIGKVTAIDRRASESRGWVGIERALVQLRPDPAAIKRFGLRNMHATNGEIAPYRMLSLYYRWFVEDLFAIPVLPDIDSEVRLWMFVSYRVRDGRFDAVVLSIDEKHVDLEPNGPLGGLYNAIVKLALELRPVAERTVSSADVSGVLTRLLRDAVERVAGTPGVARPTVQLLDVWVAGNGALKAKIRFRRSP
jgi:hypothetical protein